MHTDATIAHRGKVDTPWSHFVTTRAQPGSVPAASLKPHASSNRSARSQATPRNHAAAYLSKSILWLGVISEGCVYT